MKITAKHTLSITLENLKIYPFIVFVLDKCNKMNCLNRIVTIQDTGYRKQNTGYMGYKTHRIQDAVYRIQGYKIQDIDYRIQNAGIKDTVYKIQDTGNSIHKYKIPDKTNRKQDKKTNYRIKETGYRTI